MTRGEERSCCCCRRQIIRGEIVGIEPIFECGLGEVVGGGEHVTKTKLHAAKPRIVTIEGRGNFVEVVSPIVLWTQSCWLFEGISIEKL